MAEFQTTVSNPADILRGGGKVEIGAYGTEGEDSWHDAGALSGLEFDETMEVSKEENDNADADEVVSKQEATIKANLHEALKSLTWDKLRGDFDKKTVTPGTAVTGAVQTFAANTTEAGKLYYIANENADGTEQTISDFECGTADLVEGTDFIRYEDAKGFHGFIFQTGGNYDPTKEIRLTYNYTPVKSVLVESGSRSILPWFKVRITTKNNGLMHRITFYKCKIKAGKKYSYPKDDDADRRIKMPIEIIAKQDPLYHLDAETGNGFIYGIEQRVA